MKNKELRTLETKDLVEKIAEEEIGLIKMKLEHNITPLENSSRISLSRRNIARLKTELRKRELEK